VTNLVDRARQQLVLLAVEECCNVIRDHAAMSGMHPGEFAMRTNDALAFALIHAFKDDRNPEKMLHIHADQVRKNLRAYARENPDG
jgi:hypothetical protein